MPLKDKEIFLNIQVTSEEIATRLDIVVSEKTGTTRSQVQKLIRDGHVLVNNKEEGPGYKLRENDTITIEMPEETEEKLVPEAIPLNILYKDDYLVVVDKPAGLVVYPAAGHSEGTLMNALLHHCGKMATIG
ncbi:MAG: RNA pseudouridine synthase, partial [Nitrospirales bacterium]|nr:RNA pseudouridine synthase [Nitrospirales bacterium]